MCNNPDINIEWPLEGIENIILFEEEKKHPNLKDLDLSQYSDFNISK